MKRSFRIELISREMRVARFSSNLIKVQFNVVQKKKRNEEKRKIYRRRLPSLNETLANYSHHDGLINYISIW